MLTPTHLVAAQSAYLGCCVATGHPPAGIEAVVALVAAMFPDLDSRSSYSGRLIPPFSIWLGNRFGHRTLTHSLAAQVIALIPAWWLLPHGYFIALAAGWLSHSIADMMTKSGVCWFWPSLARCVLPGNPRYRMEVMGIGELWFLIIMAVLGIVMMPLAERAEGTTGLIRSAIGNILAARDDFDAEKGRFSFTLTLRGRDNRSYSDVSGRYAVIGPWRDSGFIIATPEGPRSTCRSTACDWFAEHADLTRSERQVTTSFPLVADLASSTAIQRALATLHADEVYLLGTFSTPETKPRPPVIEVSGDRVTLFYAEPDDLAMWSGRTLTELELTIQARHEPGVDPGQLGDLGSPTPRLDRRLERWLK